VIHHAKASSARSTERHGKRRLGGLLAILALALCALGSGASAASAEAPVLTMGTATAPSYASAHVAGEVDPNGEPVEWFFEVSTDGTDWQRAGVSGGFSDPIPTTPQPVAGDLQNLKPGTTYKVRLSAINTNECCNAFSTGAPYPEITTLTASAPTVTIDPVTTFTATTAHFSGHVTPGGTDPVFATNWEFKCTPACPGLSGHLNAGTNPEEVKVDAKQLEPNTIYQVELIAAHQGGQGKAGPVSFKTPLSPPGALTLPAFPLEGGTRALLGGNINPHNLATNYWIEYGPTATYGTSTQHAAAGAGGAQQSVRQEITDLVAGSTYHFRLVAENGSGERTDGADLVFTMPTPASEPTGTECPNAQYRIGAGAALPECRAYEIASPPNFGASPWMALDGSSASMPETWNAVASDGNAVVWRTVSGGGSDSSGLFDHYRSVRSSDGWHTRYAGPPGGAGVPTVPVLSFATPNLDRLLWRTANVGADPSDHDPVENAIQPEQWNDLYSVDSDGTFAHINRGPVEVPATYDNVSFVGASQDLDKVVFYFDRQLTATPGGGTYWTDGQTTKLISTNESGKAVATSADASLVAFGDGNNQQNLYIWTEQSDATVKAFGPVQPGAAQGDLYVDSISADGTRVFFKTKGAMAADDTDTSTDLYQYNTSTHDITLLSAPSGGGPLGNSDDCAAPLPIHDNGSSLEGCDISPVSEARDGSAAYFVSPEQLVPGRGVDGGVNLYLTENGEVRFVATLDPTDPLYDGNYGFSYGTGIRARHVRLSPDGTTLIFESDAALTNYDNAGYREIYAYDSVTDTLACASCRANGTPPTAGSALSTLPGVTSENAVDLKLGYSEPGGTLNSDEHGDRIFFNSRDAIVPKDVNGRYDVYEYDMASATPSLITSGTSERQSGYAGNGADGRDVFFLTSDTLDPRDKNGPLFKMYDARVGGGLPPPTVAQQPCDADGCKGAPSAAPAPAAPASTVFSGKGNVTQTRCPKNAVRVRRGGKVRCVKKQQRKHGGKKKHAKKKDAKHNGRAGR